MKVFICILSLILVVTGASEAASEPPKIVSISPNFWAVGVIPSSQKVVSLTFDQRMRLDSAAWFGSGSLAPESFGETSISEDQLTISLPVKLSAGKVYVFCLNDASGPGLGFQNVRGYPLSRKYLVFQMAGNASREDAPPRALSTFPGNASQDVNPATTKGITVIFDRPMESKKHGFHLFEEKKPVDLKTVPFTYSADGRIFILNFPLKPSTHYEVVMNSTEDIGFAATNQVPLWPVHFSFATGQPH